MTAAPIVIEQGRGKSDLILVAKGEPFFTSRGYDSAYRNCEWPDVDGTIHYVRMRCYVMQKFGARAPSLMHQWLRHHGGTYMVNMVGRRDPNDDLPRDACTDRLRIHFGEKDTALLFKLTFGGAA